MERFSPRTYDEIRLSLLSWLASNEPRLTDVSSGSVLTSLLRCVATAQYDCELLASQTANNLFLETATDRYLDEWAAVFKVQRRQAKPAYGYVLARSKTAVPDLQSSTLLVEPQTQIRFVVEPSTSITQVNYQNFYEYVLPVRALEPGAAGNLSAGTPLLTVQPSEIEVVVGSHRNTAGQPCGSLTGGRDLEDDQALRQRLMDRLFIKTPTRAFLKSFLLGFDEINDVRIYERLAGVIELWIDCDQNLSAAALANYEQQLEPYRPIASKIVVRRIVYEDLYINLYVLHRATDKDTLSNNIVKTIRDYLQRLDLHEPVEPNILRKQLLSVEYVEFVDVKQPTTVVLPPVNRVFRLADLKITFDIV